MLARGGLGGAESAVNVFLWTLIVACIQIPAAMANVAVQAYLMRAGAHIPGPVGQRASAIGIFRFVFYNQLFVAMTVAALFWVDMLPWFGSSASFEEVSFALSGCVNLILFFLEYFASSLQFFVGLSFSFQCSLRGPRGGPPPPGAAPGSACEGATPLYATLAIASYGLYLVGFALVARDGGVFGTIVQVWMLMCSTRHMFLY